MLALMARNGLALAAAHLGNAEVCSEQYRELKTLVPFDQKTVFYEIS